MRADLPRHPTPAVRRSDGSLWEASWPDDGWAVSLFNSQRKFCFRELEPNSNRRWWSPWRPRWVRTGLVWEGAAIRDGEFEILGSAFKRRRKGG